jgi:hypothetical protein
MVGYDGRRLRAQPAHPHLVQQSAAGVVELRDHDDDPGQPVEIDQGCIHAKACHRRSERRAKLRAGHRDRGLEGDPHEEAVRRAVPELRALGDIVAGIGQRGGDGRHDARPILAGQREDVGFFAHEGLSVAGQDGSIGVASRVESPESDGKRGPCRCARPCRLRLQDVGIAASRACGSRPLAA